MKKLLLLILLATGAVGCGHKIEPEQSCDFVQNGQLQRVSWKGQFPIEFYIHESVPEEFISSIQSAMGQWEAKLGRPLFKIKGILEGPIDNSEKDGRNVITYMNQWDPDRNREQARTTILWLGDIIYESDIKLNGSGDFSFFSGPQPLSGKVDMESLVVHELGHVLGLQHNDAVPSVMATTLSSATMRREPKPIDIQNFKCEYK